MANADNNPQYYNQQWWSEGQPYEPYYPYHFVPTTHIHTWYVCPNCKGGFSSWDGDLIGPNKQKCPFCGMKKGEYKPKESE